MANPTTNFGWVMPTSADLVTDLPADFAVFGQGVDTSMQYLLGGTTGQVLSKTSGTNMAFTWTTPTDQTPLTTKGDLFTFTTVDARLAVGTNKYVLGADSAQATGLAWQTSPQSIMTTTGDTLYASAANTPARLGIGSTGNVLTVAGGVPTWAAPAASGIAWTLLNAGGTALTGAATITVTGITSANQVMVVFVSASSANASATLGVRINTDTTAKYDTYGTYVYSPAAYVLGGISQNITNAAGTYIPIGVMSGDAGSAASGYCLIAGANATGIKTFQAVAGFSRSTNDSQQNYIVGGLYSGTSVVSSISMFSNSGNFDAGTVYVYTTA